MRCCCKTTSDLVQGVRQRSTQITGEPVGSENPNQLVILTFALVMIIFEGWSVPNSTTTIAGMDSTKVKDNVTVS